MVEGSTVLRRTVSMSIEKTAVVYNEWVKLLVILFHLIELTPLCSWRYKQHYIVSPPQLYSLRKTPHASDKIIHRLAKDRPTLQVKIHRP